MLTMTRTQLWQWTWIARGMLFSGIALSVAANVLHSVTHQPAGTPQWRIVAGAVLSASAPLFLFGCVEFIVHIPIASRWLTWTRLIATVIVGGFAAWVSYWHMVDVAQLLGETGPAPYLYPVVIDGFMVVATVSMIALTFVTVAVDNKTKAHAAAAALAEAEATVAQVAKAMQQQVDAEELQARIDAKYDRKSPAAKAKWTRNYRADRARREAVQAVAPVSPVVGPMGPYAGRAA